MSETPDIEETEDLSQDGEARSNNASSSGEGRKRRRRRSGPKSIEPPDEPSAKALDFVREVVAQMHMDCTVHLLAPKEEEDRDIRLEITGADAARIIGKKGQTLSALQFIANRMLNRPDRERRYVSVDAEGYRSRRDDSLASMAKRLGKQATTDGKIITFEPMSPRDRRVVHMALAKVEGVVTKSDGEGDDRRVQIIPVRNS